MSSIKLLSDELISQIAAGEVIERPASALKELLENSIDAGACEIRVDLEAGGMRRIQVVDNGSGIRQEDAPMAFERHATSKLSKVEDLFSIRSMGFRGEALASIASIAQVILETQHKDERVGSRIEMDGGKLISQEAYSGKHGTRIQVLGLFKHTPARKKYMKTEKTEYRNCFEFLAQVALAHPEIAFTLKHDGQEKLNLPAKQSLKERIAALYGRSTASALIPVQYHQSNLIIEGFVGKPELARSSRKYQFTFVNDRPIENRLIGHAVKEAFHSLLMHEKYPWYLLKIHIDPQFVDVNVHPRKLEVKFVNQQEVYRAVRGSVHHALEHNLLSPNYETEGSARMAGANFGAGSLGASGSSFGPFTARGMATVSAPNSLEQPNLLHQNLGAERSFRPAAENEQLALNDLRVRPIAQIAHSYIIAESEEGMVLIDQHAAHERVRYARLMENLEKESPVTQALLTPLELDVGQDGAQLLEEHLNDFKAMGFEIEAFGGNSYLVRGIPLGLQNREPEKVIREILSDVTEIWKQDHGKNLREFLLTYTACRGAIKFGDRLTMPEMEALIRDMDQTEHCTHCPHGRPAMIRFSFDKLEELFKRKNF